MVLCFFFFHYKDVPALVFCHIKKGNYEPLLMNIIQIYVGIIFFLIVHLEGESWSS